MCSKFIYKFMFSGWVLISEKNSKNKKLIIDFIKKIYTITKKYLSNQEKIKSFKLLAVEKNKFFKVLFKALFVFYHIKNMKNRNINKYYYFIVFLFFVFFAN